MCFNSFKKILWFYGFTVFILAVSSARAKESVAFSGLVQGCKPPARCFKKFINKSVVPPGVVKIRILKQDPKTGEDVLHSLSTGYFISEDGILATAFHGVVDLTGEVSRHILFEDRGGIYAVTKIIALDPKSDLALLRAPKDYRLVRFYPPVGEGEEGSAGRPLNITGWLGNAVLNNKGQTGSQGFLTAFGFPSKSKTGTVLRAKMLNTVHTDPFYMIGRMSEIFHIVGMSGGPVFFEDGTLAGTMQASTGMKYIRITRVEHIIKLMEREPLSCVDDECITSAMNLLISEAERGDARAWLTLGNLFARQKMYTQAFKWYKESAEGGLAEAQYATGLMYFFGMGAPRDKLLAVKWFKRSSDQEFMFALYRMGRIYHVGIPGLIDPNLELAVSFYERAAKQGEHKSQGHLFELGRQEP